MLFLVAELFWHKHHLIEKFELSYCNLNQIAMWKDDWIDILNKIFIVQNLCLLFNRFLSI